MKIDSILGVPAEDLLQLRRNRLEGEINDLSTRVDNHQQELKDAQRNARAAEAKRETTENVFRKEGGELVQDRLLFEENERSLEKRIKAALGPAFAIPTSGATVSAASTVSEPAFSTVSVTETEV